MTERWNTGSLESSRAMRRSRTARARALAAVVRSLSGLSAPRVASHPNAVLVVTLGRQSFRMNPWGGFSAPVAVQKNSRVARHHRAAEARQRHLRATLIASCHATASLRQPRNKPWRFCSCLPALRRRLCLYARHQPNAVPPGRCSIGRSRSWNFERGATALMRNNLAAIRAVLQVEGIELLDGEEGEGVRRRHALGGFTDRAA